jgi:hypothetical protein
MNVVVSKCQIHAPCLIAVPFADMTRLFQTPTKSLFLADYAVDDTRESTVHLTIPLQLY